MNHALPSFAPDYPQEYEQDYLSIGDNDPSRVITMNHHHRWRDRGQICFNNRGLLVVKRIGAVIRFVMAKPPLIIFLGN